MKRLAVPVLLAAALLSACTDDPATRPSAAGGSPTGLPDVATSAPSETPTPAGPAPTAPASPSVAFRADTSPDTARESGAPQTVTAVRAARQRGYDRVVLELHGKAAGAPGWRVQYVDRPTSDGSGDPVQVAGSAFLQVVVTGVGYPFDTGQTEATQDLTPKDTALVREVDLQATFEGQFTAYVGLARKAPFRVTRLADPARVVIDVRTS
ncbi:MAG: hypothetical protein JWN17_2598 [Frankiales bacterium]|nr:hypothetical protein [Frankiales bacterium]